MTPKRKRRLQKIQRAQLIIEDALLELKKITGIPFCMNPSFAQLYYLVAIAKKAKS